MTLFEKQHTFSLLVSRLIQKADELGYQITLGETWRDWSSKHSCHPYRLAIDINLFKNGVYLDRTEDHRILGEWWVYQSDIQAGYECAWGGNFKDLPDGNHYSLEHLGIR